MNVATKQILNRVNQALDSYLADDHSRARSLLQGARMVARHAVVSGDMGATDQANLDYHLECSRTYMGAGDDATKAIDHAHDAGRILDGSFRLTWKLSKD